MNADASGYTFSKAEEHEIPLALNFRRLLFEDMGVPDESLIDDSYDILQELYTKEFRDGKIAHFIARDSENTPVAIAGAILKEDFPYFLFKPGYYGWIIDVYTHPAHRGKRLATALFELTKNWLIEKGVQESKLIASGGEARRLYLRLGYRPTWEMSLNLTTRKTYNELIDMRGNGEGI